LPRRAQPEITASNDPGATFVDPRDLRAAARALTRLTIAHDQPALLRERDQLLEKKYGPGLTAPDERRLTYVRWQLYRIDDAVSGERLDEIEAIVASQERVADAVGKYAAIVQRLAGHQDHQSFPVALSGRAREGR